ncbi:hypothetical protein Xph01_32330 [Micromonospora phaseoli]|nr:hypothetical protein Xph01_32330 [Micromonospora phaseoli]
MSEPEHLRSALRAADHDQIVYDLTGIERQTARSAAFVSPFPWPAPQLPTTGSRNRHGGQRSLVNAYRHETANEVAALRKVLFRSSRPGDADLIRQSGIRVGGNDKLRVGKAPRQVLTG